MRVLNFVLRRAFYTIPTLLALSVGVFILTRLAGDPAAMYIVPGMSPQQVAKIKAAYHFNDPIYIQYWYYISGVLRGNLGYSRAAGMPVARAILQYLPATLELTLVSMLIATAIGISLGTWSGAKRNGVLDQVSRVLALGGVSVPIFWLALLLLTVFYARLGVLPVGRYDPDVWPLAQHHTNFYLLDAIMNRSPGQVLDALRHLVLPGVCLGYLQLALIMRLMRASMLEVLHDDYIRSARAKGLAESIVITKHARRNALLPTITVVGYSFGTMLTGSILTERVFNWPGMGQWAVRSILNLDTTSIMGYVLITGALYIFINMLTDLAYAQLDPRVQLA